MKNRIAMAGRIDRCWLLAYRVPEPVVAGLLPPALSPMSFGGHAFLNVVICHLSHMRPAGLPPLGLSYWHVAYRVYVRTGGEEGLYFLRSDADNHLVVGLGNALTNFRFHKARVLVSGGQVQIRVAGADANIQVCGEAQTELTAGSPFATLTEAAEFLKYKPTAFDLRPEGRLEVLRIKRDEAAWKSRLVRVEQAHFVLIEALLPGAALELCYEVAPIDYVWQAAEVLP